MIVVVTGLPRSGTSLVMQMLVAGGLEPLADGARAADADNPRGYHEYAPVKRLRRDATWLPLAEGKVVKVVVPLVLDLPAGRSYEVLHVRRPMAEVLASQAAMLARLGRTGSALPAAQQLGAAFGAQLRQAEAWLARPGVRALELEHRQLLGAPAEQAARIAAFLGRSLDVAAMAAVVDPALHRQRS